MNEILHSLRCRNNQPFNNWCIICIWRCIRRECFFFKPEWFDDILFHKISCFWNNISDRVLVFVDFNFQKIIILKFNFMLNLIKVNKNITYSLLRIFFLSLIHSEVKHCSCDIHLIVSCFNSFLLVSFYSCLRVDLEIPLPA